MNTEPKPGKKLSPEDFNSVVRLTPLVAIDLIVRSPDGKVWLGQRGHEPAKGIFFVPGGRITKNETIAEAFVRIANSEIEVTKKLSDARFLGVFEHFYAENRHGLAGFGTHYVVLAYEMTVSEKLNSASDEHHETKRWWTEDEILSSSGVHRNTKAYFQAQVLSSENQYKAIADRRNHFNTLLWQTPALSLTAQAFLLNIAANQSASGVARIMASIAALLVAICTLQLFAKHRRQEEIASEVLSAFERNNKHLGLVSISGQEHSGTTIKPTTEFGQMIKKFAGRFAQSLRRWSSFNLWLALLSLFSILAAVLLTINLNGCRSPANGASVTNAPPIVYSVVTNQVSIPASITVKLDTETQSNLVRTIKAAETKPQVPKD